MEARVCALLLCPVHGDNQQTVKSEVVFLGIIAGQCGNIRRCDEKRQKYLLANKVQAC
jgi:hypothetical protein